MISQKVRQRIEDLVDDRGFWGAFVDRDDFSAHVPDAEYHRRRIAFLKAAASLASYVGVRARNIDVALHSPPQGGDPREW